MHLKRNSDILYALSAGALFIILNLAYVSHFTGLIHPPEAVWETDHYHYLEMARGTEDYARSPAAHQPPFCWRLLTPFLAFLLSRAGLGLNLSFYLLANLFLLLFLVVFYYYLRRTGFNPAWSLLGLSLVGLTPGAVRWYEYQYWMTDPAGLFFVVLAFFLIEEGKVAYLAGLSALAAATRETYLAVIPYFFFFQLKRSGWEKAAERTGAMLLPALVTLGLIRYYIIPAESYNPAALVREILSFRLEYLWRNQLYLWTVGSFGVIFPLAWLFPGRILDFIKKHYDKLIFVLLIYASLFLAINTDRLLAYALPAWIWAALKNLKAFILKTRLPFLPVAAVVIVLQAFFYLSVKFFGYPAISVFQPASGAVVLVMCLFWLAGQMVLILRRSGHTKAAK